MVITKVVLVASKICGDGWYRCASAAKDGACSWLLWTGFPWWFDPGSNRFKLQINLEFHQASLSLARPWQGPVNVTEIRVDCKVVFEVCTCTVIRSTQHLRLVPKAISFSVWNPRLVNVVHIMANSTYNNSTLTTKADSSANVGTYIMCFDLLLECKRFKPSTRWTTPWSHTKKREKGDHKPHARYAHPRSTHWEIKAFKHNKKDSPQQMSQCSRFQEPVKSYDLGVCLSDLCNVPRIANFGPKWCATGSDDHNGVLCFFVPY